jgi:NADH:ubiquinone oxidoreductase subunit D
MLRGSGVPWDLRKAQPYDVYAEMDFDRSDRQATATAGTAISSAWIEMRSVKIMSKASRR